MFLGGKSPFEKGALQNPKSRYFKPFEFFEPNEGSKNNSFWATPIRSIRRRQRKHLQAQFWRVFGQGVKGALCGSFAESCLSARIATTTGTGGNHKF